MAANRKGEPAYENRFRNRPISGGRDLSGVRFERLPELHSTAAAGGHRWAIHGCPVCLTLSVGDLRFPGHRRRTSAVLAPVIVNILVFHALMAPSGFPLALFVAVLWGVIFVDVRPA